MRKRAIVLAVVGLVVLVVALLAMGWFPQGILLSSVESRLRAALGPKSSIKRIHVVPGKFRAEIWDLVIEGPTYRLEIPHGTLAVAPGFVLGRDLVLNSLVLEGPRLVVRPAPGPATEATLRRPVLVRDLKITGATVTYAPAPPGSEILVRDVAATGAIGFDGMLEVSAAGGVWRRPQPLDLTATRARLKVSSKLDVEIESFEGGTARSRIGLSGSLGRVGMLHPDLQLDADLGLRDVHQISEGLPALDGRVKLSGRLRQPADTVAVEARVEGSAMELAGWPVDRASGTVSYDEAGDGHAAVNLSLAGFGGEGRTELTFVGSQVQGRMRFTGVDAGKLARQGVSLGVPFAGALSGDVTGSGDLHTGLKVQATLGADGRALDGYPVKAHGSASGRVRPRERFVDLRWTLNVDASGRSSTSPPRFEALHVAGQGRAQGVLPPAVDGTFEGSASLRTETGTEPIPVKGRFQSSGGAATVDLDAQALGGRVTANADLRRSIVKKLDVTASALDLGRLSPRAQGQASLTLTASGPLDGLSGEGHVEATGVTWAGASVGNATADLHGTAGVARFTVRAPDLNLTAEGQFDRRQVAATLHLADTPLAPLESMLSPGRPLAGKASGTVDVTMAFGSPSPPVVQARLDAVDVTSGTLTARSVRPFTITSRDRGVQVQDLQLEAPGVSFQGSGSVGFDRGSPVSLKGTIDADLTKLSLPPDWKATGRVRGDVAVSGSFDRPRGEGAVTLTGVTLQRPGWPLVQVEDGTVRVEGDEAVASSLHVILPGGTLNVSGRVPLAALVSDPAARDRFGIGAGRGLDVQADLDLDLSALAESTGWTLAGRAQGQVSLTGTLRQLSPRGTLTLDGVRFARPGMPVVTIPTGQVTLEGDVATTQGMTAHVAGGAVALTGSLPLAALMGEEKAASFGFAPGEARAEAVWDGVDVQQLLEEVRPDQPSPITGTLAGQVELHGSLASPLNLSGELELPATTLRIQDLPVEVSAVRARIENGQVHAEPVTLTAQGGTLLLTGSADLVQRTIEATGKGALQLRTLSPFLEQAFLDGQAEVDVSLSGPLTAPASRGTVQVHDAAMRVRGVSQALTGVNGTLSLDGRRMTLQDMSASLGGGELKMSGSAAMAGLRLSDVDVTFTARNAGVRYPVGGISRASTRLGDIKARIDADLKLTGQQGALLMAGTIDVKRALYDADIYLGEGLFARAVPPGSTTPSRFLQSIALDIRVKTENPAVVRNNLAQLQAIGSWSVRGDLETPALYGGLELLPGGKAFLQGREFAIESGRISHSGSPDPAISVRATTDYHDVDIEGRVEDVQVTVTVGGTIDVPTVSLTSDQALTEDQLVLLLTAGTTSTSQTGGAIAGQQAALLFSERFTRNVSRGLSGLGFDQVDIQPELLSPEADPGARFTFGKDVLPNLRIIYSFGLNSTESQYYEARYRLRLRYEALFAARRFEDGTLEYSAGQRFRLGGPSRPAARGGQRGRAPLQEVKLEGDRPGQPLELTGDLAEAELRKRINAKPGKTSSYFDLSDDGDRLRQYLVEQGYLEAIVEPDRQEAVAVFRVRPGPKYTWRVEGMDRPPDLGKVVLKSLFAEEAQERGRDALLDELRRRGHLKATVVTSEVPEGAGRTLVFTVTPGPVLSVAEVTFPGATELKPSELEKAAGGAARIYASPKEAERAIVAAYREKQFLAAKAGPTKIVEENGQVRIAVPVDEGPPALLSAVRFEAAHLPESELRSLAGIETGYPYDPNAVTAAVQRIRNRYLGLGYPAVRVLPELTPDGSDLVLTLRILEGEARVIGPVTITGLGRTREWLVRGQIDIAPGDPLDPRKLSEIERRLLELGVFSRAVVTTEAGNPAPIKIEVQEAPPYKLGYDLRYNTSDGGSGLVDAEVGNLFGTGLTLGGRVRAGRELRDTRAWLHLPSLWKLGDLTATAFRLREILAQEIPPVPPEVPTEPTESIQKGIQGQFAVHSLHPLELLYGYSFKRSTITSPIFAFPISPRVAGLNASVVLNTRGNILDPIVGRFYSLALSYDDSLLGSDFSFIKGFGQAFFNHLITQRITWAQGYRLGLAWGLHGDRVPGFTPETSERFNAGGSNSVRGFETDGLGPVDAFGDHVGGEAVLVINQELRLQGTSTLGAALFYDVGNVYAQVKDFNLSLRQSLGAGLRYQSPIGLLRFDVGFPLNRRPEEKRYQIWFGLGQAF